MDAMSRALRRATRSLFSADIERAPMPDRFTRLPFNSYDGKTDPEEHLAKAGYLKEFVVDSGDQGTGQGAAQRGNPLPPPLGIIEVIHAPPRILALAGRKRGIKCGPYGRKLERITGGKKMKLTHELITFGDNDLEGTVQLHDDTLVVTARISDFLVKRVMVDQGSGADMMYPDLFRGLGLKDGDLSKYNTPLVGFDGKIVIP
nr:uncharacterized protein LOC112032019 [Quercus suber]